MAEHGRVLEIPQQSDFYNEHIRPADSRVFVIISDAMRYEVAASLADELRRETQSNVKLGSMQSIFPSITKFWHGGTAPT